MKAIRFHRYGPPEVLTLDDVDEPHPGEGQIRIAVRAVGVNGLDSKIRAGHLRQMFDVALPSGTGTDASGIVDEVGAGVTDVRPGDAVFGIGQGVLAEHALLDVWAPMPDGMSFEEAAGYPIPVETALRVLDQVGVQPGQTLLVSGASGGVGTAVVQIAANRGITVIGTAGTANQEYLRGLGAVPTTYGERLVARIRELAPDGVHAALDISGAGVIPACIELTGNPAKVLSIADFTAGQHGAQVSYQATDMLGALREAAALYTKGILRIPVQHTFPLAAASAAQEHNAAGHAAGRTVIVVP
ncbi:NADP-dependent oxidoreductase [Paractinoplanes brasiliensis]|uniref:NADPH:quinone reductase-like Zn-dependent oxidoreductase n=1 Tax=Paractinoplanes brasiliensis TaxID=52695 RepID=A0A4R6JWR6_9ACTN|nr:NADP-dependent oxidoreductase [Actinoplanes brasiliensis]TDO41214.1 NADPH:quinone reductase-like Zn-dependent oxidoreductase [Actinoplanes brasiliensis]GID26284.1 oxidoreductase [Actinoplanes brasiliensis]